MKQPNYKLGNKTLIGSAILVIIFFLLCSCGPRKVERSKTETKETQTTEATFKDSSKTVTKLESNTKIVDISQSDELVITPIDTSKEFSVNGVKYKGVVLKAKKIRNNIVTDKTENVSQIKQNDIKTESKQEIQNETKTDIKNSDKKQYDWTKTIIVIAIILGVAIWLIYFFYFRKAKKVIDEVV